jgi:hypothetical protein
MERGMGGRRLRLPGTDHTGCRRRRHPCFHTHLNIGVSLVKEEQYEKDFHSHLTRDDYIVVPRGLRWWCPGRFIFIE